MCSAEHASPGCHNARIVLDALSFARIKSRRERRSRRERHDDDPAGAGPTGTPIGAFRLACALAIAHIVGVELEGVLKCLLDVPSARGSFMSGIFNALKGFPDTCRPLPSVSSCIKYQLPMCSRSADPFWRGRYFQLRKAKPPANTREAPK